MKPILEVAGICKTFEGGVKVLDDISFQLFNELCIIAGPNGAGKTCLANIIAGLEGADSGEIKLNGEVGLIFQNADAQILGQTPLEDIALGPKNMKLSKEEIERRIKNALADTGLTELANYTAQFLSGGQKKRLSIAGILALERQIIIFDEPYANLDFDSIKQINRIILNLKKQQKTILILSHEIEKCLAMADRFIILNDGKIKLNEIPAQALKKDLSALGIHNPLGSYKNLEDLLWI
ncbi:MAG: energy-coupling factor ABC transporter ATP-binding protein [Elusimicrobiota bacterium]|jgi:biotin transport system ATP-binding protein|nr:energy-coupling factor ABC transporter ATP-binding protein [Elusimicrobiota bacterium]